MFIITNYYYHKLLHQGTVIIVHSATFKVRPCAHFLPDSSLALLRVCTPLFTGLPLFTRPTSLAEAVGVAGCDEGEIITTSVAFSGFEGVVCLAGL